MPYSTPPTFSTGQILTATQLNVLSGDIEYLNSITDFINVPFSKYVYGLSGAQNMGEVTWVFRHRHQYLHYSLSIDTSSVDSPLEIIANWGSGDVVLDDFTTSLTAGNSKSGYCDLTQDKDANPISIPQNALLEVRWETQSNGLSTAHFFLESSATSI